jgi:hypothetical protein
MAIHQRKINSVGGPVEIELFAGDRHVLSYRCTLMRGNGTDRIQLGEGDTVDTIPDTFLLPQTASELSGKFVSIAGLLSPMTVTGGDQNFSLEIRVSQDGALVGGSPVTINGKFQNTIGVLEHVEL